MLWIHKGLSDIGSSNQMSSSSGAIGKLSSVVSSWKNCSVVCVKVWCCAGKGSSALLLTGLLFGVLRCHRCG